MTRIVRNLKAASKEFSAAVRWYEEQRSGLGGEFFDAVVRATSVIQAYPEIGTPSRDGRTRRVLVQGFPYQVVYRPSADEIVIIAVAHLKRRPGYWRNRKEAHAGRPTAARSAASGAGTTLRITELDGRRLAAALVLGPYSALEPFGSRPNDRRH